jgi:hypothetical protein
METKLLAILPIYTAVARSIPPPGPRESLHWLLMTRLNEYPESQNVSSGLHWNLLTMLPRVTLGQKIRSSKYSQHECQWAPPRDGYAHADITYVPEKPSLRDENGIYRDWLVRNELEGTISKSSTY